MDIKKAANLLLNFVIKRLAEIFGILIFAPTKYDEENPTVTAAPKVILGSVALSTAFAEDIVTPGFAPTVNILLDPKISFP